jgi:hypothetical protein
MKSARTWAAIVALTTTLAAVLAWRVRRSSMSARSDEDATSTRPRLDYRFVDRYRSHVPRLDYRFNAGASGSG